VPGAQGVQAAADPAAHEPAAHGAQVAAPAAEEAPAAHARHAAAELEPVAALAVPAAHLTGATPAGQ